MSALHQALDELRAERDRSADRLAMLDQTIDSLTRLIAHTTADPPGAQPTTSSSSPDTALERTPGGKARPRPVNGKRFWSDDDKAAAVALADRVGATEAGKQLGCASTMIRRWKREGSGRAAEHALPQAERRNPDPEIRSLMDMPLASSCGQIERSPLAGKGAWVPSGIPAPRPDVQRARAAAFEDPEQLG